MSPAPGSGDAISHVAVIRAEPVFTALPSLRSAASHAKLLAAGEPIGLPLGENLPGLRLVFSGPAATSETAGQQRLFYYGALALALSVTGLGGFVLWRDVRREMHLAGLRSQFVSSVPHELRTPLTAIGLLAETLHKRPDADPKRQSDYLETILSESQRLTRMVDNVLDFSRIEQGSKTYRLGPAALPEVVRGAARAIAHPLAQLGFRLKVEAEEELPPVRADADALQQAILNLLSNAMKYSGESREIELRLRRDGEYAVVQVTDHGPGIPAAHHQRIFERFYRAPTPENENVPGTGLGLTLVAHIVEGHRGKVELQSAPGQGSTFSILLPLEVRS